MHVLSVIFSAAKEGYRPEEWEDGAAAGARGLAPGGDPPAFRFAVADGATESYESRRWVRLLTESFMSADAAGGAGSPEFDAMSMHGWLKTMQDQWHLTAPAGADYIEQLKIRRGTLATFVGGQFTGLDTPTPAWQAVALGDSVLFHVRQGQLVDHFPRLSAADFDSAPDGISTLPERLGQMTERLLARAGWLAPGDLVFVATDAFAKWMIGCHERGDRALWPLLGELAHPDVFARLVADMRGNMTLKDDDVTLMRLRLVTEPPGTVVTCL